MSRKFKITYTYAIQNGNDVMVFNMNTVFELAGLELSTHSEYSPFHYKGDIIRLPNNILEEVINTCETKKVEKVWVLTTNRELNGRRFPKDFDHKPTEADILQYIEETKDKLYFEGVKLEFYYKIIDNV